MQSHLTTFGPEETDPTPDPPVETSLSGRMNRCIAITDDGTRCSNEITYMERNDFCGVHTRHEPRYTINDDPLTLIRALGRGSGNCWAIKTDGDRCTYSTSPVRIICGQHQSVEDPSLIDRDDLRNSEDGEDSDEAAELDQVRIVEGLSAIGVDLDVDEIEGHR
jgi:hypothetical protein